MSRIVAVSIILAVICKCSCNIPPEAQPDAAAPNTDADAPKTDENNKPPVVLDVANVHVNNTTANATVPRDKAPAKNQTHEIIIVQPSMHTLNEPALHRLFYVLLGLSTVTVCYVALKMYRVRKGVARPTHVRKYGVLTQRSDIEMEPLQLDDDEDDDTVFDVGAHANR